MCQFQVRTDVPLSTLGCSLRLFGPSAPVRDGGQCGSFVAGPPGNASGVMASTAVLSWSENDPVVIRGSWKLTSVMAANTGSPVLQLAFRSNASETGVTGLMYLITPTNLMFSIPVTRLIILFVLELIIFIQVTCGTVPATVAPSTTSATQVTSSSAPLSSSTPATTPPQSSSTLGLVLSLVIFAIVLLGAGAGIMFYQRRRQRVSAHFHMDSELQNDFVRVAHAAMRDGGSRR